MDTTKTITPSEMTRSSGRRWLWSSAALLVGLMLCMVVSAMYPQAAFADEGSSDWPDYRYDTNNNSVTGFPLPNSADNTSIYWAVKEQSGTPSRNVFGSPIIVGDYVYAYTSTSQTTFEIRKLDKATGEVEAKTALPDKSFGFARIQWAPVYADGRILVAIDGGRIKAFDADNLELLWTYTSPIGMNETGNPLIVAANPITIHNGYVYAAYNADQSNSTGSGDIICLSTDDEGVTTDGSGNKVKAAKWTFSGSNEQYYTSHYIGGEKWRGFYYASAYVSDNFMLIGSNGATVGGTGTASTPMLSLNPTTGAIIDVFDTYPGIKEEGSEEDPPPLQVGSVNSTVVRDEATGLFYYTTRGGYLCQLAVNEDGTFKDDGTGIQTLRLKTHTDVDAYTSWNTPIIYQGRAYVGVDAGASLVNGGSVNVVDLTNFSLVYCINAGGLQRAAGLITTAYEGTDGYVYLYVTAYGGTALRCFKDNAETTEPQPVSPDGLISLGTGTNNYYPLVADGTGAIYLKDSTGNLVALGKTLVADRETYSKTLGDPDNKEIAVALKVPSHVLSSVELGDYVLVEGTDYVLSDEGRTVTLKQEWLDSLEIADHALTFKIVSGESAVLTITVTEAPAVPPTITTASLPAGVVGETYNQTLSADGTTPITWSIEEGNLPDGLTLEEESGIILGTPEKMGIYTFTVKASNRSGIDDTKELSIKISAVDIWQRLSGMTALDTMGKIIGSEQGFTERGGTVVVATESGYWDALTASGLAGIGDAPVLMTNKDTLSFQTAFELGRLAPSRVVICGGAGAVSNAVSASIQSLTGVTPERFSGKMAPDTARVIYEQNEGWGQTAIVATANGFQDALSIAPYAYSLKCPIFLTEFNGTLSEATLDTIKDGHIENVYIVGGNGAVAKSVEDQLGDLFKERLAGKTAIDTSAEIATWEIEQGMSVDGMGVATANGYQDALSGAALCGKNNAVLALVAGSDYTAIDATAKEHASDIVRGYVFGGRGAVSQETFDYLESLMVL